MSLGFPGFWLLAGCEPLTILGEAINGYCSLRGLAYDA
jgi:hypothetical protein